MDENTHSIDIAKLSGAYRDFYHECVLFIPKTRIYSDPIRTLAFGTDASFYRLIPKLVIKVRDHDEVSRILQVASRLRIPVTFRAAGTSLSGQAVTDSVLLVLAGGWCKYTLGARGETIVLEPGLRAVEEKPGIPPYLKNLDENAAALLIDVRGERREVWSRRSLRCKVCWPTYQKYSPLRLPGK